MGFFFKKSNTKPKLVIWRNTLAGLCGVIKDLRLGKSRFFYISWYENNIINVNKNDLLDEQGTLISLDKLQLKVNIKTNHVTFSGLGRAILSDILLNILKP